MYVIIPTSKKAWRIILRVVGVIALICAIWTLIDSIAGGSPKPVNVNEVTMSDLSTSDLYYTDELYIIDAFATETTNSNVNYYCLAGFYDANDDICIGTFKVNTTDAYYKDVVKYVSDENIEFCSFYFPVYFSLSNKISDSDLVVLYNESIEQYISYDVFRDENLLNNSIKFKYDGNLSVEEITERVASSNKTVMIAFFVIAALSLGIAQLLSGKKKKENIYEQNQDIAS